jgi:hypothetical protein
VNGIKYHIGGTMVIRNTAIGLLKLMSLISGYNLKKLIEHSVKLCSSERRKLVLMVVRTILNYLPFILWHGIEAIILSMYNK